MYLYCGTNIYIIIIIIVIIIIAILETIIDFVHYIL